CMAIRARTRRQTRARQANERIHELALATDGTKRLLGLVCECSREGCIVPIIATRAEYEAVRADPSHCLVGAGHVWDQAEQVVIRTKQYWVVKRTESHPASGETESPSITKRVRFRLIETAGAELGIVTHALSHVSEGESIQLPDGREVTVLKVYATEAGQYGDVQAMLVVDL